MTTRRPLKSSPELCQLRNKALATIVRLWTRVRSHAKRCSTEMDGNSRVNRKLIRNSDERTGYKPRQGFKAFGANAVSDFYACRGNWNNESYIRVVLLLCSHPSALATPLKIAQNEAEIKSFMSRCCCWGCFPFRPAAATFVFGCLIVESEANCILN